MASTGSFNVSTRSKVGLVDITEQVVEAIRESGVSGGAVTVYTPHTTSALMVNENEPGLVSDLVGAIERLVDRNAVYEHNRIDNNAPAHIAATFLGPSIVIPVVNKRPALGTWQSIFFVELDGPRSRRVTTVVIGE